MTRDEMATNFHRNVKQIADELGITLNDIRDGTGLSKKYFAVTKLKNTAPTLYVAYRIADYLQVPITDLFQGEEDREKEKLRREYLDLKEKLENMGDHEFLRMV